jgi:hypothetical protein
VEPPAPPQPLSDVKEPPSIILIHVLEAKLFSNHPNFGGIQLFVKCEMNGNSESSEIVNTQSLNPRWNHQFEVPVEKGINSKLEIKLFEQFTPYESVLLGKVDIYTSQIPYYMGFTKTFPLDPVTRSTTVPEFSIARFLLVLRSSLVIEFANVSAPLKSQEAPSLPENSIPISISSPLPPLPPRSISSSSPHAPTNLTLISMPETSLNEDSMTESGYQKPLPPLPQGSIKVAEEYEGSGALLISANKTPHPVKPTQTWFGKISEYFSSGSSSLVSDTWYHRMLKSEKNEYAKFESLYYAYETRGHAEMLKADPEHLSSFVYLYVPGLYSGRKVGGPTSAEGKLTKHQERVNEMKALGLDARLVVVPNDGTVLNNSEIISRTIREVVAETNKYIVLIGYSKGGVDASAALALNPWIVPWIRVFITLFSPLYGSHIAADIEDSMLRPVVFLAIKNLLEADTAAVRDLSFKRRGPFIASHPFDERVPSLSLASAITTASKTSPFLAPYKYILSKYNKENDGLVACQDALYPGSSMILIPAMDHVGPRPEYPIYRNHVSFILSVINTALDSTQEKWALLCSSFQQPSELASLAQSGSISRDDSTTETSTQSESYPPAEDDFYVPDTNPATESNLIDFGSSVSVGSPKNLQGASGSQSDPINIELPPEP